MGIRANHTLGSKAKGVLCPEAEDTGVAEAGVTHGVGGMEEMPEEENVFKKCCCLERKLGGK